jgi:hypothetical protein
MLRSPSQLTRSLSDSFLIPLATIRLNGSTEDPTLWLRTWRFNFWSPKMWRSNSWRKDCCQVKTFIILISEKLLLYNHLKTVFLFLTFL